MFNYSLEELKVRLEKAITKTEAQEDDYEQFVYDLEQDLVAEIQEMNIDHLYEVHKVYSSMLRKLKELKKEYDFFDEEAELDMMFPDRHDDDFDEDSMSYDSVFGDD